jgi:glycosyltransferase involved in cell wall biosynthesis
VVTCTDSDGVKELVQPGQGGLVVSPDADALGQAFDKLYNDRDLAAQLGDEAYRAINRLIPDWGYVVERLLG